MFAVSRSFVFVATLSLVGPAVFAQDGKTPPAAPHAGKQEPGKQGEKKETFAVVEAGHHLSAMADSAVEAMRKQKHAAYEAALAEFHKEKAAAEASKQPFDKKAPTEEAIQVVKTGLASMADAEKAIAELKKAHEKPKDKPAGGHDAGGHDGGNKKKG